MCRILLSLLLLSPTLGFAYTSLGYVTGQAAGDQFGTAMCSIDFNADHYADFAISAPAADPNGLSSGKVYIYYGGPSADTIPDKILSGPASSFFGMSLANAHDFNGDGADDLVVGAPFYDVPATSAGAAFLFFGGTNPDTIADLTFLGHAASDYFGISVAGLGNWNEGGAADIAIGAYRADWGSFTDAGKVYIYYGTNTPDTLVDKTLVGTADGERFGYALTAGNFISSMQVVAVGAYSYDGAQINQGRVYTFLGKIYPDSIPDVILAGDSAGENFGWSLAKGHMSSTTYEDVVVGCDGYPVDTFSAGRVQVYGGGILSSTPYYTYGPIRAASDFLGSAVASGANVAGDIFHEVVAGMPGDNDGGLDAGGAVVLKGGASMSPDTTILGSAASEEAGKAVGVWGNYQGRIALGIGSPSYDNYRGRVRLFLGAASDTNCCVGSTGNVNMMGVVDLSDLSMLIAYLTLTPRPSLPCPAEANVNTVGIIDLADLSLLIKYLTGPPMILPVCP